MFLTEVTYTHPDYGVAYGYDDNPSCSHYANDINWDYHEIISGKMYVCYGPILAISGYYGNYRVQYDDGMTWGEWLASDYNDGGWEFHDDLGIIYNNTSAPSGLGCGYSYIFYYNTLLANGEIVQTSDVINPHIIYNLRIKHVGYSNETGYGSLYDGTTNC